MTESKRREKDRLPKDVSKLTSDDVLAKVFGKRVAKKLKEVAHDGDDEGPKSK